jgi:hypothetical protein
MDKKLVAHTSITIDSSTQSVWDAGSRETIGQGMVT